MDESAGGPSPEPYDVEPTAPVAPRTPPPVPLDARCRGCGYLLTGLTADRNCPECGMSILRSISGNLLIFSSPEYLAALYRGLICILLSALASAALMTALVLAGFIAVVFGFGGAGSLPPWFEVGSKFVSLPLSAISFYGWWLFSTPDPAIVAGDKGDKPRLTVRVTVAILVGTTVLDLVASVAAFSIPMMGTIVVATFLLAGLAGVVQFFASLLYVRWIAPRLPNPEIEQRTRKYLWQLPLLYILLACVVFVGPLIATILYLLLLNDVRKRLQDIRQEQTRELATML